MCTILISSIYEVLLATQSTKTIVSWCPALHTALLVLKCSVPDAVSVGYCMANAKRSSCQQCSRLVLQPDRHIQFHQSDLYVPIYHFGSSSLSCLKHASCCTASNMLSCYCYELQFNMKCCTAAHWAPYILITCATCTCYPSNQPLTSSTFNSM